MHAERFPTAAHAMRVPPARHILPRAIYGIFPSFYASRSILIIFDTRNTVGRIVSDSIS